MNLFVCVALLILSVLGVNGVEFEPRNVTLPPYPLHWIFVVYHKTGHDITRKIVVPIIEKCRIKVARFENLNVSFPERVEQLITRNIWILYDTTFNVDWYDEFMKYSEEGHTFRIVHIIRNPYDMVMSGYLYHQQLPMLEDQHTPICSNLYHHQINKELIDEALNKQILTLVENNSGRLYEQDHINSDWHMSYHGRHIQYYIKQQIRMNFVELMSDYQNIPREKIMNIMDGVAKDCEAMLDYYHINSRRRHHNQYSINETIIKHFATINVTDSVTNNTHQMVKFHTNALNIIANHHQQHFHINATKLEAIRAILSDTSVLKMATNIIAQEKFILRSIHDYIAYKNRTMIECNCTCQYTKHFHRYEAINIDSMNYFPVKSIVFTMDDFIKEERATLRLMWNFLTAPTIPEDPEAFYLPFVHAGDPIGAIIAALHAKKLSSGKHVTAHLIDAKSKEEYLNHLRQDETGIGFLLSMVNQSYHRILDVSKHDLLFEKKSWQRSVSLTLGNM